MVINAVTAGGREEHTTLGGIAREPWSRNTKVWEVLRIGHREKRIFLKLDLPLPGL